MTEFKKGDLVAYDPIAKGIVGPYGFWGLMIVLEPSTGNGTKTYSNRARKTNLHFTDSLQLIQGTKE